MPEQHTPSHSNHENVQTEANKYVQNTLFDVYTDGTSNVSITVESNDAIPQVALARDRKLENIIHDKPQDVRNIFTPADIVHMMVKLLDPQPGAAIYDPYCGSGTFLTAAFEHLKKQYAEEGTTTSKFYGQEPYHNLCTRAKAALSQYACSSINIREGDALQTPNFWAEDNTVVYFDYIISNPPWNQRGYDRNFYLANMEYFKYGIPKRFADWGWFQYILFSLKEHGRAAILTSMGPITRDLYTKNGSEFKIRNTFIEHDHIEAVIRLPDNLFPEVTFPCAVLFLNRSKSVDRRDQILVVDASKLFVAERSKKFLTQEGIDAIIDVYKYWETRRGLSKVITIQEAREKRYNLSPSIYRKAESFPRSLEDICRTIEIVHTEHQHIYKKIADQLEDQDIVHLALSDELYAALGQIVSSQSTHDKLSGIALLRQHLPRLTSLLGQEIELEEEYKQSSMYGFFTDPTWSSKRLGDITTVSSGGNPRSNNKEFYGNEYHWVQIKDLNNGTITSTTKMLSKKGLHSILKKEKAKKSDNIGDINITGTIRDIGTVLVGKINACNTRGKLGILGVPAATNVEICCIEPNSKRFDPLYLMYHIIYIRHIWEDDASQTRSELHVSNDVIKDTEFVLPPLEIQAEIINKMQTIENRIKTLKSEKDILDVL